MLYYKDNQGTIISVADETKDVYDADAELTPSTQEEYDAQMEATGANKVEAVEANPEEVVVEPVADVPAPETPAVE